MDSLEAFLDSYSDRLVRIAQSRRLPISGTFELLPNCNMQCRMCYIQHAPQEALRPADFWVDLYRQAIDAGMLYSLLTGGEPLLYPWFEELYEQLADLPVYLCLNTNATLLNREKVAFLAQKPPKRINISLYGASNETYAELCNNPNGFDQVMHAFELLNEYGILFRVHTTLVPENIHDFEKMAELCNQLRVPFQPSYYVFPSLRKDKGESFAEDRFSPKELAKVAMEYSRRVYRNRENEFRIRLLERTETFKHPETCTLYGVNTVTCRGGVCSFWVNWRGQLSGCGIHNQNAIDLSEVPFAQAWQKTATYTNTLRISEKCKTCPYHCICPTCPAAGFCETGAMDGTPEYLCAFCEEYARLLMEERRRLFGEA